MLNVDRGDSALGLLRLARTWRERFQGLVEHIHGGVRTRTWKCQLLVTIVSLSKGHIELLGVSGMKT